MCSIPLSPVPATSFVTPTHIAASTNRVAVPGSGHSDGLERVESGHARVKVAAIGDLHAVALFRFSHVVSGVVLGSWIVRRAYRFSDRYFSPDLVCRECHRFHDHRGSVRLLLLRSLIGAAKNDRGLKRDHRLLAVPIGYLHQLRPVSRSRITSATGRFVKRASGPEADIGAESGLSCLKSVGMMDSGAQRLPNPYRPHAESLLSLRPTPIPLSACSGAGAQCP